jgi:hypothetical protein
MDAVSAASTGIVICGIRLCLVCILQQGTTSKVHIVLACHVTKSRQSSCSLQMRLGGLAVMQYNCCITEANSVNASAHCSSCMSGAWPQPIPSASLPRSFASCWRLRLQHRSVNGARRQLRLASAHVFMKCSAQLPVLQGRSWSHLDPLLLPAFVHTANPCSTAGVYCCHVTAAATPKRRRTFSIHRSAGVLTSAARGPHQASPPDQLTTTAFGKC